jgi:DNA polymerase-3 subunit beta
MRITVSQSELNTGLALVGRAVASRPSHPVLANVLLTADATTGRLQLTGYDLSLGIQTSLPAAIDTPGSITLPARLLGEIVARLSADSPITLSCPEDGEQVELTSTSGRYQVQGLPAVDYPDLPAPASEPVLLPAPALVQGLRATLFASSNDEGKQLLTGVHLQTLEAGLEFAATDGHRLAVLTLQAEAGASADDLNLTIPSRALRELERLLPRSGEVELLSSAGQVVVRVGEMTFTSRSLEGTYPNYQALVPASFSQRITLDRRAFVAALERVAVLADRHNNVVKLTVDPAIDRVAIRADAQDVGSGSESLAAGIEGDEIQIAFNVRYLLDGLKTMASERVLLLGNAPTTPVVIRPDEEDAGFTYLVMPVQVRS